MIDVRVISQTPPGGRCSLYTDYGQALALYLGTRFELQITAERTGVNRGLAPQAYLPVPQSGKEVRNGDEIFDQAYG